jgi:hypothetical protein
LARAKKLINKQNIFPVLTPNTRKCDIPEESGHNGEGAELKPSK